MPSEGLRSRRSCLAVPGSNPRFLEKAKGLDADQVFLDLEDSVAPVAKPDARGTVVEALNSGGWGGKTRVVRVNDWTTEWTYRDVTRSSRAPAATSTASCCPRCRPPTRSSRSTCC